MKKRLSTWSNVDNKLKRAILKMEIPSKKHSTTSKNIKAPMRAPTPLLLRKKAKCDADALKIVEKMLDSNIKEDWLLQNLSRINKSHMEDIVEERSIGNMCGYPLCDNPLKKLVKKQYQICTLKNKVYDIERVKNFCSYSCYTSAEYLMAQMLTSPLWLREQEEIPQFNLKPKDKSRVSRPPGVEVDFVRVVLPDDAEKLSESVRKEVKKPMKDETSDSICKDIEKLKIDKSKETESRKKENLEELAEKSWKNIEDNTLNEEQVDESEIIEVATILSPKEQVEDVSRRKSSNAPILEHTPHTRRAKRISCRKYEQKSESSENFTMHVEKSLQEWITPETIALLHGEEVKKQRILESLRIQDKYAIICKKLNHSQLEEARDANARVNEFQPAPDLSVLREEAKALNVKVRAFYEGKEIANNGKETNDDKEPDSVLPLTDLHAPKALRRRIFLDKLNKVLPDLLRALVETSRNASGHSSYTPERYAIVKALVSTFSLSATNITFKSAEWTLVALIIIKLKQAFMYTRMILMAYKLDSNYLERLTVSLTNPTNTAIDQ